MEETLKKLAVEKKVPAWLGKSETPLDFLIHESGAESIIDAAYRYARHEPGANVILFGSGVEEHIKTNLTSILKPPLPVEDQAKLEKLFSHLTGIGLDFPEKRVK